MNEYYLNKYLDSLADAEERCPKCSKCGDPIWEETAYEIDGKLYCKGCIRDRSVEADKCDCCGKASDDLFEIDGEIYCIDCLDKSFLIYLS